MQLPYVVVNVNGVLTPIPTNDDSIAANFDVFGGNGASAGHLPAQGNYDSTLAIDPTNQNILYMGGTADPNPYGFIRIDTTTISDPYAQRCRRTTATTTADWHRPARFRAPLPRRCGRGIWAHYRHAAIALLQPPCATRPTRSRLRPPWCSPASRRSTTRPARTRSGCRSPAAASAIPTSMRLVTYVNPLTGETMLIFGDDQGIWLGEDQGDGSSVTGIGAGGTGGTGPGISYELGTRNGNIQIPAELLQRRPAEHLGGRVGRGRILRQRPRTTASRSRPRTSSTPAPPDKLERAHRRRRRRRHRSDRLGHHLPVCLALLRPPPSSLPSDFFIVDQPGAWARSAEPRA